MSVPAPVSRASIRARALRLQALREHSRAELERKLLHRMRMRDEAATDDELAGRADCNPQASDFEAELRQVLDDLEQQGLLSDLRTADALLHAKAPRYGSRRLEQMLRARALDAQLVLDTLSKAKDTELERATVVWRQRFGQRPATLQERARQQRFLLARGFEPSVIERVMKLAVAEPLD